MNKGPMVVVAGLLGVALAGCGEVHAIQVDETATDLAQAICVRAYDCCSAAQRTTNMDLTGATEAECEQETADRYRGILQEVQFSVDKKRSAYAADKVDACLRTLRGSDCTTLNMASRVSDVPECGSFTKPLVAVGGSCSNDYECIAGWCRPASVGSGDGTCAAFATGDMSCADNTQVRCADGFICDSVTDRCTQPGSVTPAPMCFYGSDRIPIRQMATELAEAICTKAYECCTLEQLMDNVDLTGATQAECQEKTGENFRNILQGVQSSVDKRRATYLADKVDACLTTMRQSSCTMLNMTNHLSGVPNCNSFASPLVVLDRPCNNDYECVDGWCKPPAEQSGGDGTCTAFASGDTSCADNKQVRCASGWICDPDRDKCVHMGETGEACVSIYDCKSGMCTSQGQGGGLTCAAPAAPGPMCFYQSGCSATDSRPGPVTIVLLTLFAAIAIVRARRGRDGRSLHR